MYFVLAAQKEIKDGRGAIFRETAQPNSNLAIDPDPYRLIKATAEVLKKFNKEKLECSFQCYYLCRVNKREQIMIAAMKLFVANGVQGTPMSAIARTAGTGMGTIYNYFDTKETLINAIYLHIKTSEIAQTLKNIDPDAPIKVKFLGCYSAFINFYIKFPESFAFMDQMQNNPIITDAAKEQGKTAFAPVLELIVQGQQEGIIKPIGLESIIYFLAGTMPTFVRWLITVPEEARDQKMEQHLQLVWDGIKA